MPPNSMLSRMRSYSQYRQRLALAPGRSAVHRQKRSCHKTTSSLYFPYWMSIGGSFVPTPSGSQSQEGTIYHRISVIIGEILGPVHLVKAASPAASWLKVPL